MNRMKKLLSLCLVLLSLTALFTLPALAAQGSGAQPEAAQTQQENQTDSATGAKALAVSIAIGLAAAGGAIGMGLSTAKAVDGIARQPEAENKIRTGLMLGLVFIETAIIYALLVVILVIFVL